MRPASIFERSSTSLIRRSRWRPFTLDVRERLLQLRRHFAVDAVDHHLAEAEDRVHRRAQLVAHVGQEFGLGLAGSRQLQVERPELGGRLPLSTSKRCESLAHVVHPVGERSEFVTIRHRDCPPKLPAATSSRKLCASRTGRMNDHEITKPQSQREQHGADREDAGQDQRAAVGGVDAVAQPRHPVLLRVDELATCARDLACRASPRAAASSPVTAPSLPSRIALAMSATTPIASSCDARIWSISRLLRSCRAPPAWPGCR